MTTFGLDEPRNTRHTIANHLRARHGYELAYTVVHAPRQLLNEHDRIHAKLRVDHTHLAHDAGDDEFDERCEKCWP